MVIVTDQCLVLGKGTISVPSFVRRLSSPNNQMQILQRDGVLVAHSPVVTRVVMQLFPTWALLECLKNQCGDRRRMVGCVGSCELRGFGALALRYLQSMHIARGLLPVMREPNLSQASLLCHASGNHCKKTNQKPTSPNMRIMDPYLKWLIDDMCLHILLRQHPNP